jgi:hypothetical protein
MRQFEDDRVEDIHGAFAYKLRIRGPAPRARFHTAISTRWRSPLAPRFLAN